MTLPVVAGSAVSKSPGGSPPPEGLVGTLVDEVDRPFRQPAEVDDDVRPFGRADERAIKLDWRGQNPPSAPICVRAEATDAGRAAGHR